MKYYSRRLIKPTDLNHGHVLFGGTLLSWIDEEAAIFAACQLKAMILRTKLMSEINFTSSAQCGDVIEFGFMVSAVGRTSLTVSCQVRNKTTQASIMEVEKIVFVSVGDDGKSIPHGVKEERHSSFLQGQIA